MSLFSAFDFLLGGHVVRPETWRTEHQGCRVLTQYGSDVGILVRVLKCLDHNVVFLEKEWHV